jgi:transposase
LQEHFASLLPDKRVAVQSSPPLPAERPGRIFCQDESRFGLLPIQRRRITLTGVKPLGRVQSRFENFDVYGAVEPTTGESFFLELPSLNATNFQIFLEEFAPHSQEALTIVLLDNGRCHTAKSLEMPENLVCLFLPPYRPELNPIARLWQDVKAQLAWVLAAALDALEHHIEHIITRSSTAAIQTLTSYPYFVQAVNALYS